MDTQNHQIFDYIIIGAGSAGCVLANRLSADPNNRILVLEAGCRDDDWLVHIPSGVAKIWNKPKYNWSYFSDPEPNMNNRRLFHPRGKILGGSSSINMTAYVRGNKGDFDRWGQMGLIDWSYEKVLPYFKKSENYLSERSDYRGHGGPMKTALSPTEDPIFDAYIAAGENLGYPFCSDYNGAGQEGFSRMQFTAFQGRRQSTSVAFLRPALSRPNLEVITEAHVQVVDFDGTKATGIQYKKNGTKFSVLANKEVILAAGTYNSAQTLLLSGIGPADQLRKHGINVVVDRPNVGSNLQDHPSIMLEYERKTSSDFQNNLRYDRLILNMIRAQIFKSGPATHPLGLGTGFVKSRPEVILPDIQILFRRFSVQSREWFPLIRKPGVSGIGLISCHLRPESRGEVCLVSNNPNEPPKIVNNFLSSHNDCEALRSAFKINRSIGTNVALSKHLGEEILPGNKVESDDDIDQFIRETAATVYHPVGTCRMGVDEDAVVDAQLKVRGCQNIRVVDASVMPDLVGGNINATVIMIAEKAADYIRES